MPDVQGDQSNNFEAGFVIPYRPGKCRICHPVSCLGWEEFAVSISRIEYHKCAEGYAPETEDIVQNDGVFEKKSTAI